MSSETEVCFNSIKQDLKKFYHFPKLIDALPEEVFFETLQVENLSPSLFHCKTALTLTPSSMILKVRHKKSGQEIGVYLQKTGIVFRIPSIANKANFARLTEFFDRDLQMQCLINIVQNCDKMYEIAFSQ